MTRISQLEGDTEWTRGNSIPGYSVQSLTVTASLHWQVEGIWNLLQDTVNAFPERCNWGRVILNVGSITQGLGIPDSMQKETEKPKGTSAFIFLWVLMGSTARPSSYALTVLPSLSRWTTSSPTMTADYASLKLIPYLATETRQVTNVPTHKKILSRLLSGWSPPVPGWWGVGIRQTVLEIQGLLTGYLTRKKKSFGQVRIWISQPYSIL